jgi:hypothetical protein
LDTLLLVADRGVDRQEAVSRAQDVTELVSHVRDPVIVAKMLTKYSLALMQNVDERTSQELGDSITKIMADTDVPDAIKIDIVALRLGVVVGPDVLEAAVAALGDRLTSTAAANLPPNPTAFGTTPAASVTVPNAPIAPKTGAAAVTQAAVPPTSSGTTSAAAPSGSAGTTSAPSTTPTVEDLKKEIDSSGKSDK